MTSGGFRVVVVGGGPAGSAAALRLARLGHKVTLVERQSFPRDHVGEALSPGVALQLEWLGLGGDFLDRHGARRHRASAARWAGDWEVRPVAPGAATVDRARFDAALLDAARMAGVEVLQPARAASASFADRWQIAVQAAEGQRALVADFLVDATGRSGFHGRKRRLLGPRTAALHALWAGTGAGGPRVAAGRDHWIWASPIPGLGDRVMVFCDPGSLPGDRRGIEAYYWESVRAAGVCSAGRAEAAPRLCDASAYVDTGLTGPRFLRVGEAAYAIDPLSSSGVEKAISTGLQSAVAVNTILRRPEDSTLARSFYEEEAARTVRRQAGWAASAYAAAGRGAGEPFWAERAAWAAPEPPLPPPLPGGRLRLAVEARFEAVAVLTGNFVTREEALVHPRLERPIAYVAGRKAAPLLRGLQGTAAEIEARLRNGLSDAAAAALLGRMAGAGLLVPAVEQAPRA